MQAVPEHLACMHYFGSSVGRRCTAGRVRAPPVGAAARLLAPLVVVVGLPAMHARAAGKTYGHAAYVVPARVRPSSSIDLDRSARMHGRSTLRRLQIEQYFFFVLSSSS
jgi:hypothetical protein